MSSTSQRNAEHVTGDLVRLACAGIEDAGIRGRTAARVVALVAEGNKLAVAETEARYRKSLGRAYSAFFALLTDEQWLDIKHLEPELWARLRAVFLGEGQ